ncbi:MAG: PQQ-dependent sugar dehydrogenase, partial [Pseudomonadales bacterium]|nr:PQQ-dependent sugar dehydrogenase [Pseudomonadales bacterium]
YKIVVLILLMFSFFGAASARELHLSAADKQLFSVQLLTDQLVAPWALAYLQQSQSLLITEKDGKLFRYDLSSQSLSLIPGVGEVQSHGQGGLMDIAISEDFSSTKLLYFSYAKQVTKGKFATSIASAQLIQTDKHWKLTNWQDLFISRPASASAKHFGSRIIFDGMGHLFFSIGDRGVRANAQNLNNHAGSILRLNLDGSVPADNPFVGKENIKPEIYSYGHRNPQGLYYDKGRQQLFAIEHGPRGGDEINLVQPGRNYGWPVISYGKEYWGPVSVGEGVEKPGMQQPLMYYSPSIAPSSLIYYQQDYFAQLQGSFLAGSLVLRHMNQIKFSANYSHYEEWRWFKKARRRIRDLTVLSNGTIALITDSGELHLVVKSSGS